MKSVYLGLHLLEDPSFQIQLDTTILSGVVEKFGLDIIRVLDLVSGE